MSFKKGQFDNNFLVVWLAGHISVARAEAGVAATTTKYNPTVPLSLDGNSEVSQL